MSKGDIAVSASLNIDQIQSVRVEINISNQVEENFRKAIEWYYQQRVSRKFWSKWILLFSVISVSLSGLVPIVNEVFKVSIVPLASTLLLALAGIALAIDKVWGLSSGWKRYMLASRELQSLLDIFLIHRTVYLAQDNPSGIDRDNFILRCLETLQKCEDIINAETSEWARDLSAAIQILSHDSKSTLLTDSK